MGLRGTFLGFSEDHRSAGGFLRPIYLLYILAVSYKAYHSDYPRPHSSAAKRGVRRYITILCRGYHAHSFHLHTSMVPGY